MSAKTNKLKEIAAQKKKLNDEQKAIRDELKESSAERKKHVEARSESRKSFTENKSQLRKLLAKSYLILKDGTSEEISEYANDIIELSTAMAVNARTCSDAVENLDEL